MAQWYYAHDDELKNLAPCLWRIEVQLEGKWYLYKEYRKYSAIQADLEDCERRREAGEVIVPGRVVLIKTGQVLKEIEPSGEQPAMDRDLMDVKDLKERDISNVKEGKPEADAKTGVIGRIFGGKSVKQEVMT